MEKPAQRYSVTYADSTIFNNESHEKYFRESTGDASVPAGGPEGSSCVSPGVSEVGPPRNAPRETTSPSCARYKLHTTNTESLSVYDHEGVVQMPSKFRQIQPKNRLSDVKRSIQEYRVCNICSHLTASVHASRFHSFELCGSHPITKSRAYRRRQSWWRKCSGVELLCSF